MPVVRVAAIAGLVALVFAAPAAATPVCTDGYMGGPPADLCGGRIFPEAELARGYVQYTPDPFGFIEYQHGIEYLAQKYPRWISRLQALRPLRRRRGQRRPGRGALLRGGRHRRRPRHPGHQDHRPQRARRGQGDAALLAVGPRQRARRPRGRSAHRRGPRHRRRRTAARSPTAWTTTSRPPAARRRFHEREVTRRTRQGGRVPRSTSTSTAGRSATCGTQPAPSTYTRGNSIGTDLNRQMPTVGRINTSRNPLEESEMHYGTRVHARGRELGQDGKMAYGADIHGEMNSQAYMDIMYPAGEFDSVDHRRLMAIAERTKSVIDATLYDGIIEEMENASGGNDAEYARRSRSSPRTGRPSGTRSATPTPASSATTWPPISGSPAWTTRSCSTTRSRRRRGTSISRRTTSTPRAGSSRPRWPTRSSRRREFNDAQRRGRSDRPGGLRGRTPTR